MKFNFQKLKEICRTKQSIVMFQALVEAEAELREMMRVDRWGSQRNLLKEILGE